MLEQQRFFLDIVKEELDKPCPAVYTSVGKVFILQTQDETKEDLAKRMKELEEEEAAVNVCDLENGLMGI